MKKKTSNETDDDDLLPEYGPDFFRGLKPNPYAREPKIYKERFVILDEDVSSFFASSEVVNAVLRDAIHMAEITSGQSSAVLKHAAKTVPASRVAKKRRAS